MGKTMKKEYLQRLMQQNELKKWVNLETAKELDKEPFSSLPLKMRIGILILLCCFVIGHGGAFLAVIIPGINRQLTMGSLIGGSLVYVCCWFLGVVGLALAGKDCVKYPIYFFAKFLKRLFPKYFAE